MIRLIHRVLCETLDLSWWSTIESLPSSIRIVHHLLMLLLLNLELISLLHMLKIWHLKCPILIQMRVHLTWRLQPLHDQVTLRVLSKLINDLLRPCPVVSSVDECHNGLDCREANPLLLVVKHLEQHLEDLVGVKLRADLLSTCRTL